MNIALDIIILAAGQAVTVLILAVWIAANIRKAATVTA